MRSFLAILVAVGAGLPAQSTWKQIKQEHVGLRRHAASYDTRRSVAVAFGGDVQGQAANQTWEWDGGVATWTRRLPATSPPPRMDCAMAYDAARRRTVMFGGFDRSKFFGDTWEWDGVDWVQVASTGPSPRHEHAMAYDPIRKQVVLVGGAPWHVGNGVFVDTWTWDGTTWTEVTPAVSPPTRSGHGIAFFLAGQSIVLFGGNDPAAQLLTDTWSWDGVAWTEHSALAWPPGRIDAVLCDDSMRRRVVLVGGWSTTGAGGTWEWDGNIWSQRLPAVTPAARYQSAAVWDGRRGTVVMSGGAALGSGVVPSQGDTWELVVTTTADVTPFGAACGGAPALESVAELPWLQANITLQLDAAPSALSVLLIGGSRSQWQGISLPYTLPGGCPLLVSADAGIAFSGTSLGLTVAPITSMLGQSAYAQALVVDPAGWTTSNALDLLIAQR